MNWLRFAGLAFALIGAGACSNKSNTPPSAPDYIRATVLGATAITISWNAATDDVGVASYNIFDGAVQVGSSAITWFKHTGLAFGSRHCYTVRAVDASLNMSNPSSEVCVTTSTGGIISGTISYAGSQHGQIAVVVIGTKFNDPGFDLKHVQPSLLIAAPGDYVTDVLADGTYYVAAAMITGGSEQFVTFSSPWAVYGSFANPSPVTISNGLADVEHVDMTLVDGTADLPNPFGENDVTMSSCKGTVVGVAGESGKISVTITPSDSSTATASGVLTLVGGGSAVDLIGTFDSSTSVLSLSGSGYTFTGAITAGVVGGTYTKTGGTGGQFNCSDSSTNTVVVYCGTWSRPESITCRAKTGVWNLVSSNGIIDGRESDNESGTVHHISGTVSGNTISATDDNGGSATGTISGDSVSGTFINHKGCTGTWAGSANGC